MAMCFCIYKGISERYKGIYAIGDFWLFDRMVESIWFLEPTLLHLKQLEPFWPYLIQLITYNLLGQKCQLGVKFPENEMVGNDGGCLGGLTEMMILVVF